MLVESYLYGSLGKENGFWFSILYGGGGTDSLAQYINPPEKSNQWN
jgi:hypothetical protein